MNKGQIDRYECCKKYLEFTNVLKEKIPPKYTFPHLRIEQELEDVHSIMYKDIIDIIEKVEAKIKKMIDDI